MMFFLLEYVVLRLAYLLVTIARNAGEPPEDDKHSRKPTQQPQ